MPGRIRYKARDMRHADNVAEAVHIIYGGRPSSQRINGDIARCMAPEHIRGTCNGIAFALASRPGVYGCTGGICRMIAVRPLGADYYREGYLRGPSLLVPAERLAAIEPLARHYVRRYMQEATASSDELLSATARYIMAAPGSDEERTCEATIDAACAKRTHERIQAHRHMQQMRLYRHVAARFKAETPWRKAVVK
jgi:hypothetical protein